MCVQGDLSAPGLIGEVLDRDTASVFHLAAVVSGGAEADFDLGYRVNLDGTRRLLEACRQLAQPARLVFASSVAAFGGDLPDGARRFDHAQSADLLRRAEGDRRVSRHRLHAARVSRRPLAAAADDRGARGQAQPRGVLVRERHHPRAAERRGRQCPVAGGTGVWLLSPRKVVDAFIHAHDLPSSAWGTSRVVNLPGITVTVTRRGRGAARIAGDSGRRAGAVQAGRAHRPDRAEVAGAVPDAARHRARVCRRPGYRDRDPRLHRGRGDPRPATELQPGERTSEICHQALVVRTFVPLSHGLLGKFFTITRSASSLRSFMPSGS